MLICLLISYHIFQSSKPIHLQSFEYTMIYDCSWRLAKFLRHPNWRLPLSYSLHPVVSNTWAYARKGCESSAADPAKQSEKMYDACLNTEYSFFKLDPNNPAPLLLLTSLRDVSFWIQAWKPYSVLVAWRNEQRRTAKTHECDSNFIFRSTL